MNVLGQLGKECLRAAVMLHSQCLPTFVVFAASLLLKRVLCMYVKLLILWSQQALPLKENIPWSCLSVKWVCMYLRNRTKSHHHWNVTTSKTHQWHHVCTLILTLHYSVSYYSLNYIYLNKVHPSNLNLFTKWGGGACNDNQSDQLFLHRYTTWLGCWTCLWSKNNAKHMGSNGPITYLWSGWVWSHIIKYVEKIFFLDLN
jgi:hypothetical protein